MAERARPERVGIVAMEAYFPKTFVSQKELERWDGCEGKYTKGLEQRCMAFATDREDVNSICLTALDRLLSGYGVEKSQVGRLEVGTESLIDKSKSVKTVLMSLFEDSGHTDIEGADTMNACYGGTNALLNAVNWVESSSWDGRWAVVVTGDIAVYASGPARATGGCGAIALLIGPDAPIALQGPRASHMEHAYDFYKPIGGSMYPIVDGRLSVQCYGNSLDTCYVRYAAKYQRAFGKKFTAEECADYVLFHSPYQRLVRKSFGRLTLLDMKKGGVPYEPERIGQETADEKGGRPSVEDVTKWLNLSADESYYSRELQGFSYMYSATEYERKVQVADLLGKDLGNLYAASIYGALVSLVCCVDADHLDDKNVLLYSYGSGLASTMFGMHLSAAPCGQWSIERMQKTMRLNERLAERQEVSPELFHKHLAVTENAAVTAPYQPLASLDDVTPGAFYLVSVDDMYRRQYARNDASTKDAPTASQ